MKIKAEKVDSKKMEEYEIKDCVETLMRAEEIKSDPKKMAAIQPYLNKKMKVIKSLADLKGVASERIKEIQEEEIED